MNQRIRRGRGKGKGQRIDASTVNTGGYVANHSRDAEPEVRVPQKATGDVSPEATAGLAKASPWFKELKEVATRTASEEQKAIAEATEEVVAEEPVAEVADEPQEEEETAE